MTKRAKLCSGVSEGRNQANEKSQSQQSIHQGLQLYVRRERRPPSSLARIWQLCLQMWQCSWQTSHISLEIYQIAAIPTRPHYLVFFPSPAPFSPPFPPSPPPSANSVPSTYALASSSTALAGLVWVECMSIVRRQITGIYFSSVGFFPGMLI